MSEIFIWYRGKFRLEPTRRFAGFNGVFYQRILFACHVQPVNFVVKFI
jgi:hypothetical protein